MCNILSMPTASDLPTEALAEISDLNANDHDAIMEVVERYQDLLGLDYAPSRFQVGIFDHIVTGRGHAVVNAVAGSGKTTTIVSAARLLKAPGKFFAFNKVIAEMLAQRLKGTEMASSTVHSHGFAAIRGAVRGRVKVDSAKYKNLVKHDAVSARENGVVNGRDLDGPERDAIREDGFPTSAVLKLLDCARLDLLDPRDESFDSDLLAIIAHHMIQVEPVLVPLVTDMVANLMFFGWDNPQTIDFTDMLWLPVANGYAVDRFAWVFIDECQDISKVARKLIAKSIAPGGRALFVGDPKQAIYGFAGADATSFAAIIEEFDATVLPLSVCYRCPVSVIAVASEYCPEIEARDGAPVGTVRESTVEDFVAGAREGDMVLCRLNAPLLPLCFSLIAAGVSASVRGRDIGAGLSRVVTDCSKRLRDFDMFDDGLDAWMTKELAAAKTRYKDLDARARRVEYIADQVECIRIILARSGATSTTELKRAIEDLFSDKTTSVVLSSVHRAKGLEADRVFIAAPDRLGVARAGCRPWMAEQEDNLFYVAVTRAKAELVWLRDDARPTGTDDHRTHDAVVEPARQALAAAPSLDAGPSAVVIPDIDQVFRDSFKTEATPLGWQPPAPLPEEKVPAGLVYEPASANNRKALARLLDASLREVGFAPVDANASEVVYARTVEPGLECRVFSTIVNGAVRPKDKDAIRVTLVYVGGDKPRGVGKDRRVFRTGKIAEIPRRVLARVANMDAAAEGLARCGYCRAPTFKSKRGNQACAALCWTKREEANAAAEHRRVIGNAKALGTYPEPGGDDMDSGWHDDAPALLPTADSFARAARSIVTGRDHMEPGDISDQDRADAYLDD